MEEKECKYCKRIIPAFAEVCPHCLKKQKQALTWRMGCLIAILTIVLLALILAAFAFFTLFSENKLKPLKPPGSQKTSSIISLKTSILCSFSDNYKTIMPYGKGWKIEKVAIS